MSTQAEAQGTETKVHWDIVSVKSRLRLRGLLR